MTGPVLARRAAALPLRRVRRREEVFDTLWFIPLCSAVAAAVLSGVLLELDAARDLAPDTSGFSSDGDSYGVVAGTVAAAMLTFLGAVFATTLVAVQLAASQYSPRIVRVFVRSRLTQSTLAVFLATFVFALLSLVRVEAASREFVPQITLICLVVLVLGTVAMFIAYIHGMVRLLRVQYLLRLTARASHGAVDDAFPASDAYSMVDAPEPSELPLPVRNRPAAERHRGTPRILQAIDVGGLADVAAAHDCWVEMCVAVGAHVGPGTVVAKVHGHRPGGLDPEAVQARLLFGSERTLVQDPAFGIRQLVDTASRALSPAVNDPTTAVQALARVVDLLERVADRPDPSGWYTDADGAVRVRLVEDGFERLARLGLTEIIRYGADAPQVTRALLGAIDELATVVSDDRRSLLAELRTQCMEAVDAAMPGPFREQARQPDRSGLG